MAIAPGQMHSLALKADGTVVGWGFNYYGQTTIPAGLTNVVAIAAGYNHSLALKADGTVVGWGYNVDGEATGVPNGAPGVVSIGGHPLTNVVSLAAGASHSLALKADGTVVGWGYNMFDEISIPANATNVVAIAAGDYYGLALRADGTVVGWGGTDYYGQTTIPASATSVVAVSAGGAHNLALKADGTIIGWGDNENGETTIPLAFSPFSLPVRHRISAGDYHSLALKADGTVVAWGWNAYGQTNVPGDLTNVVSVVAGGFHNLALKADGTVVGWGAGTPGTSGDPNYGQADIPDGLSNVVAIAAGFLHSLALRPDGTVFAWGDNYYGQTTGASGADPLQLYTNASPGIVPFVTNAVAIAAGKGHSLALLSDGTVIGWGEDDHNEVGSSGLPFSELIWHGLLGGYTDYGANLISGLSNVVAIAAGGYASWALKADGTVVAWGDNAQGQQNVPVGLSNVVAIASESDHCLALKSDGTVVGWGNNTWGQSTGVANPTFGPVSIGGQLLTNVVAVAGGFTHSLAIRADGTVVGWGAGTPGYSGDYSYGQATIPTNVVDLAAWGEYPAPLWNVPAVGNPITAVAAGSAHCLALTANGAVVGWGLNTWGQANVPAQAQSGVQAVSAGLGHSLALTTSGGALAWGLNDCGQANVPASATNGVVAISAGGKHNLALRADGEVVAWGLNGCGQTTVNDVVGYPYHVQGDVIAIAAGGEHSLALMNDGSVVGWGDNDDGQATGNSTINTPNFVAVGGQTLSGVVAIAAGRYHSLALTSAGKVFAWGLNASGQCNVPAAAQSGVVAIAAGKAHSAALKADGSVVTWGSGPVTVLPPQAGKQIAAIAAGDQDTLLLAANTSSAVNSTQSATVVRAQIPARVISLFQSCNQNTITELGFGGSSLDTAAGDLSGAKQLLAAVLQLGMPYTLEHDGILHGFLYGSEALMDTGAATSFLAGQNALLQAVPYAPPQVFGDVAALRFQCFTNRLYQCLTNLQAIGQPEIPRLLGHTLRLLYLCADAYTPINNTPPPALEMLSVGNQPSLLLYGEPYVNYTLQSSGTLSSPNWVTTTLTNLLDGQTNALPVSSGASRFYRAVTVVPSMQ